MKMILILLLSINLVNAQERIVNKPELNIITTSEIGSKIAERSKLKFMDAILIEQVPTDFKYQGKSINIQIGDILPFSTRRGKYQLYYEKGATSESINGICFSDSEPDKPQIFLKSGLTFMIVKKKEIIKTSKSEFPIDCNTCYKQEFIYNGKSGNTIKFTYREYINDMARSAFNQDLVYDLSESNIIGFKGLRVEVLNTSNTGIEYKIIQAFTTI